MSFEEKSAWITGLGVGICWLWYAIVAAINLPVQAFVEIGYRGPLIVSVVIAIVIIIASHIVVSIFAPREAGQRDERDRDIERFGNYVGQFVIGVATLGILAMAMLEMHYFWIANLAYLGLALSEIVTSGARIAAYRFGIHQW